MMNRRQLANNLQTIFLRELTLWRKYRKYALYRRTEDFVQWLLFDTSEFDVAVRPHYSLQALATQFPAESLTIGNSIRDKRGVELWIKPDDWRLGRDELIEQIVKQITPSALKPLTIDVIQESLNHFESNHPSSITACGIADIVAGDLENGYHYLEQALNKYKNISQPWARVEEVRLSGWLSCASDNIVSVLRQQAEIGAQLLRLK